jgi:hypothetical protein
MLACIIAQNVGLFVIITQYIYLDVNHGRKNYSTHHSIAIGLI